jgi:hypothetical protein
VTQEACGGQDTVNIIHGHWDVGAEFDERIIETERMVRMVLSHIAHLTGMIAAFLSLNRDAFLDQ